MYLDSRLDAKGPEHGHLLQPEGLDDAVDGVDVHLEVEVGERLVLDLLPQRLRRHGKPVERVGTDTSGCGSVSGKLLSLPAVSSRPRRGRRLQFV